MPLWKATVIYQKLPKPLNQWLISLLLKIFSQLLWHNMCLLTQMWHWSSPQTSTDDSVTVRLNHITRRPHSFPTASDQNFQSIYVFISFMHIFPTLTTFRLRIQMSGADVFSNLPNKSINVQLGNITDQHLREAVLYRNILELFLWIEKFYLFQPSSKGVSQSCVIWREYFPRNTFS